MNNKGFIQAITILLILASAYQLSFTGITNSVEKKALVKAEKLYGEKTPEAKAYEKVYLDSMQNEEVYPLLGFTYEKCKENELNLGLDLQGGMNVTLEVQTPEVLKAMAGKTEDQAFKAAFAAAQEKFLGQENFIDAFQREYEIIAPQGRLASIFYTRGLENELPNGHGSSNAEV